MARFDGKTALVTGASRGIGREIAHSLAAEGARVFLVGRSREELEKTRALLGSATILVADLRSAETISAVVAEATRTADIDILINAAGAWHGAGGPYYGPQLPAITPEQINEVLNVGLRAAMLLSRLLLPGMIERRSGKILNIACGFTSPQDAIGWLHYYVTNKAIQHFTEGLAAETRHHEIQVNCIAPWLVATEAVKQYYPGRLKKAIEPRTVAELAAFLVSADADHISGAIMPLRSKLDYPKHLS